MADEPEEKPAADATPQEVPRGVELPIEALLAMPPPTAPNPALAAQLVELAQEGYAQDVPVPEPPPEPPSLRGEKLREALQQTPEALNKLKDLSPRNLAKDTVSRGIDAALEAGGLRTPTRPQEPQ
jgi:hypothetical protein